MSNRKEKLNKPIDEFFDRDTGAWWVAMSAFVAAVGATGLFLAFAVWLILKFL